MTTGNLTIQDNDTVVQYTSVGESSFVFPFPILETDELKVSRNQVLLTFGVDYSISGLGDDGGGTITLLAGASTPGDVWTLWQDMPIERLTGFSAGAAVIMGTALNAEFAARLRVEQQLRREIRNSLRLAPDDPQSAQDMVLPTTSRAGKFLTFGPSGEPLYASGIGTDTALRGDLASAVSGADGARLVGFRRTEAGAAGRTVNAKLLEQKTLQDFGATGNGVSDDTAAVAAALATMTPRRKLQLADGEFAVTAFDNSLGGQIEGAGYVRNSASGKIYTPWGRRAPLVFGAELMYAFQSRILASNTWRATFTGDSTTAGTGVSAGFTFPELFLKAAQRRGGFGCTTVNRGQAGKSSKDWVQATANPGTPYITNDLIPQPHLLVVRWGINDGYTAGDNLTAAQSIANLRTGLATARATYGVKDMAIIVCTPNSTSDSPQGRDERFYEQIIHGYRQAALDYQCGFIDLYSMFQDSRGGTYASGNSAAQLWMDDPYLDGRAIHPKDMMAAQIALAVANLACSGLEIVGGGVSVDRGTFYTKLGADAPSTYPTGLSVFRTDTTGGTPFPRNGFVQTWNHPDDGQLQFNWGFGSAILRTVRTRFGRAGAWDPYDGEWIAVAPQSGWANVGGAEPFSITRDMYGRVSLKGRISGGTTVAGDLLGTAPAGYRPAANAVFPAPCSAAMGQIQVIAASGRIEVLSGVNNTYLSLEGINWMAVG